MDDLKSGRDSNPWPLGSFPPSEVPTLPPDLPEKLMDTLSIFDLSLSLPFFQFLLRDFHFEVNVNLVLNRTLFSFKDKEIFNKLLVPTDFSLHQKTGLTSWTHKKRLELPAGLEPTTSTLQRLHSTNWVTEACLHYHFGHIGRTALPTLFKCITCSVSHRVMIMYCTPRGIRTLKILFLRQACLPFHHRGVLVRLDLTCLNYLRYALTLFHPTSI